MVWKILIIDDEVDFGKIAKINLERDGDFSVYTATSGKQGFDAARKIRPEVILLDIIMPEMDGFKVLEMLKKDTVTMRIPVIMLSALTDDTAKLRAAGLYDEEYVTKPVETLDLRNKIEKVLRRHGVK